MTLFEVSISLLVFDSVPERFRENLKAVYCELALSDQILTESQVQ